MFFGERVPYTNFHDLNLDELIKIFLEQKNFLDNELVPLIESKIEEAYVNVAINYESGTKTLVFTVEGVDNNG